MVHSKILLSANKLILAFAVLVAWPALSAEFTLKTAATEAPKEIDESIRSKLQTKALQLLDGDKPVYEFWLCAEAPLKSKPEAATKGLANIKETTLLGAVAVRSDQHDYRNNDILAGVYTMRLGLQPQDGDHLGTADYPYFAVLTPIKRDTKLDGLPNFNALVKASGKDTATGHPMILGLRPAASDAGEFPRLNEPAADHKSILVKLPAAVGDQKTEIVFDLVYIGKPKI